MNLWQKSTTNHMTFHQFSFSILLIFPFFFLGISQEVFFTNKLFRFSFTSPVESLEVFFHRSNSSFPPPFSDKSFGGFSPINISIYTLVRTHVLERSNYNNMIMWSRLHWHNTQIHICNSIMMIQIAPKMPPLLGLAPELWLVKTINSLPKTYEPTKISAQIF